jgi:serine phosphatase RsbU (regulator of sigma subunit)/pSer/pThr/pTyr-binding forkhead associated (FHA) protein
MAYLLVLKGANPQQRIPLNDETVILGRNPDCHVPIPGTAVSRNHAQILQLQGKFYLEDLKSRNGTFVNNEQITARALLNENDRIKICDFLCTFHETTPKPLPESLRPEETEPEDDDPAASTVEASLSHASSNLLLQSQPAEKLQALLEISSNLSRTLELDPLLPKILDSLFQLFKQADRGFIILRDETTKRLIPKAIRARRANDEAKAQFSRSIVRLCLDTVQAKLIEDASHDPQFAMSQSIADFRIRSVMCVPLASQEGKAFGVIQLDTQDRSKKFNEEDLKLLMGVANYASVALENAKLHEDGMARERLERDLHLARQVQRGFLPQRSPEVPGYEFFPYYESAQEVGGDYYDFIPLGPQRLAVMLGDVAGKGVPAALLMAKVSADARYCMLSEPEPAAGITKLNTLLQQAGIADRFVTLVAAVLDCTNHTVTLVNAGHPSPLLYRRATATLEEATPKDVVGLPIGVVDGFEYSSCQVQLQPGDGLLIFSDGVTDAMDVNSVQFHVKGIYAAVQGGAFSPRALGERIVKAVKLHAAGRPQHDDITMACFGRTERRDEG